MTKVIAATAERQMAKNKKVFDKGQENVAAALDALDGVSMAVAKSTAIVKRRIEELDEIVEESEARLHEVQEAHNQEIAALKERYTRDTTALQTKLVSAEEKLRKVQATLA